jgi:hypothetical protein
MTSSPEVFLFHELGVPVLGIALITDGVSSRPPSNQDEPDAVMNTIVNSVRAHATKVPNCVKLLVENSSKLKIPGRRAVAPMSVSELDVRGVTEPDIM